MDGCQDMFGIVDDEHRQAVSHLHRQQQPGVVGNYGIPFQGEVSRRTMVQANDTVGMALAQPHQEHGLSDQTCDKVVLNLKAFDILSGLLETRTDERWVVPGRAASQAETVNQPRAGRQRRVLQV